MSQMMHAYNKERDYYFYLGSNLQASDFEETRDYLINHIE